MVSALPGNHCSGTDQVIQLRKAQLQKEGELEKVKRKKHLDFLDILLLAKVSVGEPRGFSKKRRARRQPCTLTSASPDGEWEQLVKQGPLC